MTALLQGLLHITDLGGPLTKTALPVVATCFAIQNAVGIPSVALQTEHVYDLSGGVTFVAAAAVSLLARVLRQKTDSGTISLADLNWRQLAMTGGVMVYATRCPFYLSTLPRSLYPFLFVFLLCVLTPLPPQCLLTSTVGS